VIALTVKNLSHSSSTGSQIDPNKIGARVSDKVSDTAQRLKPEEEKSILEKAREKVHDTLEAAKEKAHDVGYQMGLTSDSPYNTGAPYEKTTGEKLKESGARASDKVSDTAQRLKPEEEKSVLEKAREKVHDTFEAAKEKVHDVGYQMGLTSDSPYSNEDVSETAKRTGAHASDKVSDTAQRLKPEDQKSLGEKAREKATDTWEATKQKAHEVGKRTDEYRRE